ncbi:MAG: hypothetical protein SO016_08455 [Lachnospiraceae bacterium]|nr:hypothetical protein [Robinsoniella sp.]MDY3766703.1 hypothetical protein [Lachnospiraceae bacterium]
MNRKAAKQFILQNARPIDLAVYKYFFENESNRSVVDELSKYQNQDGGFGHGLELDYWNPNSSPIATNDAIITLFRVGALGQNSKMTNGIVQYLESLDSFDKEKKRWLFAIDSNKEYPHAIWWEKNDDGIHGFNPTISLATFVICYGKRTPLYEQILREGLAYLEDQDEISGDALKSYLLSYELLKKHRMDDIIDLNYLKKLIYKRIRDAICKDIEKYGVEYVPTPSDFFSGTYLDFLTPEIRPLVDAEKNILGKLQKEDGGFDISWEWGTPYPEFAQARNWWRPRLTIDKLLFDQLPIA